MANAAAVLASLKVRLGLTDTTFDTQLGEFRDAALRRLYPRATFQVDPQEVTSITVDDYGECVIDMSTLATPILAAREVEAYDGYTWRRITSTKHHGIKLRLRGLNKSTDTKLRINGLKAFPAIDNVYDHLLQALYWYAISEFYDFMASNKAKYNIYLQQTGARAVDNMRDESVYYEQRADRYLEEQNETFGV